ncbi:lipid-A-disaccharide synthase [Gilvimarinus sp. SDUM040013]|uniref:Lipid-A-disaccharide synthase n=1 Tax=Gilvimarinus gilvus TaxID=3058038 RepID=A0ABU4S484_9GAMM|nr:lipid-A-disaccharide synthase [Gilvimarinus sp. SDUM040013]MDO3385780.1 lipid-A-disaccharide synthase [Gilvimarinus sp. SDUM040013]MDX6850658.1 lipid-A-disaccharide synthase [Gilvimarinus sp. SDUM040013]
MTEPVRIAIVAGESSGDLLGAGLIQALKHHYPHVEFSGIGGPKMLEQGFHSFFPQDRLAVMGLVDPLMRLPELLKIRRFLFEHFTEHKPDLFLGIDSPDFNLTLEEKLRKAGVTTAHYVSPSVWAWRSGRIKKIKRAVDLMLTILPFENVIYQQHQVPVKFVGHPLADEIAMQPDKKSARQQLQLDEQSAVVALMPGSRHSEVERLGPLFFQAAKLMLKQRHGLTFVLPAASGQRYKQLHQMLGPHSELPVKLVQGQSQEVMAAADVVLLASGTTALEAMLLKKPMVVSYKMAWLSFQIMKAMALVRFVALPNLLADRELVPELLQSDATPEQMAEAVLRYFDAPELTSELIDEFKRQHHTLKCDANASAASALVELIEGQS